MREEERTKSTRWRLRERSGRREQSERGAGDDCEISLHEERERKESLREAGQGKAPWAHQVQARTEAAMPTASAASQSILPRTHPAKDSSCSLCLQLALGHSLPLPQAPWEGSHCLQLCMQRERAGAGTGAQAALLLCWLQRLLATAPCSSAHLQLPGSSSSSVTKLAAGCQAACLLTRPPGPSRAMSCLSQEGNPVSQA